MYMGNRKKNIMIYYILNNNLKNYLYIYSKIYKNCTQ